MGTIKPIGMKSFKFVIVIVIVIAFVVGCSTKNNGEPGSSSESEWIDPTVTVDVDQGHNNSRLNFYIWVLFWTMIQ